MMTYKAFFLTLFLIGLAQLSESQTCYTNGPFTTQAQLNTFFQNNPCTIIGDDLEIYPNSTDPIIDLGVLQNIQEIQGDLIIYKVKVPNFSGLENLTQIGGHLMLEALPLVVDCAEFNKVQNIGEKLRVYLCHNMTSLTGLNQLNTVKTIAITANNKMADFTALSGVSQLGGYLNITSCPLLTNLQGLHNITQVNNFVSISNLGITDLSGLDQLQTIGNKLRINLNANLVEMTGLNQLTSIGKHLEIIDNPSLLSLRGLESLVSINGTLDISRNDILPTLCGIENIDYRTIYKLILLNSGQLSACSLPNLCDFIFNSGNTTVSSNAAGCNTAGEVTTGCGSWTSCSNNCTTGTVTIEINDYPFGQTTQQEICSGDLVRFSTDTQGVTPTISTISWELDEGNGWTTLPTSTFIGYDFSVIPTSNILDCNNQSDGYIDQKYRATVEVVDPQTGTGCIIESNEYDLRLCCPISMAVLSASPTALCAMSSDTVDLTINTNDLFITNPGLYVTIEWYQDGQYLGTSYDDQSSIQVPVVVPAVTQTTPIVFEARVNNCANKQKSFSTTIMVDPTPICGTLTGLSSSLNLVGTSPHLIYELCSGEDAVIGEATHFAQCNRVWQYSFDLTNWTDEGSSSNPQLNTNVLPWGFNWPAGATSIYYRIQCNPLTSPSGCSPCFSDPIEIRLKDYIPLTTIVGPGQVCIDNLPSSLTVQPFDPDLMYVWYRDGKKIGPSVSLPILDPNSACYEVEVSNGCEVQTTAPFCLDVCEIIPIISCPLPPNESVCPGQPITLDACDSQYNCGNVSDLIFTWIIKAGPYISGSTGCTVTGVPVPAGTTYELTITDPVTGCSATASKTIVPCP